MAAEFVIAGRRELPSRDQPWELEIENAQGGVSVREAAAAYDENDVVDVIRNVGEVVGWRPATLVFVRKAWELAQVVAEELATAVEGAVFCDVDGKVFFDAQGKARPAGSVRELEGRLRTAFDNPQPFFDRWEKEERAGFKPDAEADDWSDVET